MRYRCAEMRILLYIEAEEHHVAILHNIVFPFTAVQTLFFCLRDASLAGEVVKRYDFRANETALKIASLLG